MMYFSDFRLFFRSLFRNKLYTVITVFGFAVSLTFVLLLSMYIQQELSVDDFHENKERIFRMTGEEGATWGACVGDQLQSVFPEIEAYTRIYKSYSAYAEGRSGGKLPLRVLYVDTTFWNMFTFPLIEGRHFNARNEIVLSVSFARKIFGEESPLGKGLTIGRLSRYTVVGIMPDLSENTHFDPCDIVADFTCLPDNWISHNNSASFALYLLEKPGCDLSSKIPAMLTQLKKDFWMYKDHYRKDLFLESLKEVYWSTFSTSFTHHNSWTFIGVLTAIIVVILILALINYNNLSIARAGFRAKESAIKKLLGSNNKVLFRQYIIESMILCFIAFGFCCCLASVVLPWFNDILETHLVISRYFTFFNFMGLLIAMGIIGLIAGVGPAWLTSRFCPVEVMKGSFRKRTKNVYGKILISFQYCMAIILIICTLLIWKQTNFMKNYDLGFTKDNLVWLESKIQASQKEALRNELSRIPGVEKMSYAYGTPLDGGDNNTITDYAGTGKLVSLQRFEVDEHFFDLFDLQIIPTGVAYTPQGIWLNEAAAKAIGTEALPQEIMFFDEKLPVLGIIKNFHIRNLNYQMSPLIVFRLEPELSFSKVLIKISSENQAATFDQIKKTYTRFIEGIPFESGFVDQTINSWYESNARTARLVGFFSIVAIVLSMMGILAMATYFIQQRVKEIGIRRVNGATVREILGMLISGFIKWVVLAFIVACPVACYLMNRWLQEFPYRTELSWWVFALAGSVAFAVALLMVGGQSVKVACENPVKSLQKE